MQRSQDLLQVDFGGPLHSLIIAGECHDMELELLKEYMLASAKEVDPSSWDLFRPESGTVEVPPPYRRVQH